MFWCSALAETRDLPGGCWLVSGSTVGYHMLNINGGRMHQCQSPKSHLDKHLRHQIFPASVLDAAAPEVEQANSIAFYLASASRSCPPNGNSKILQDSRQGREEWPKGQQVTGSVSHAIVSPCLHSPTLWPGISIYMWFYVYVSVNVMSCHRIQRNILQSNVRMNVWNAG